MYVRRKGSVRASELADYLNRDLFGSDFDIQGPSIFSSMKDNSIVYLEGEEAFDLKTLKDSGHKHILFLSMEALPRDENYSYIISENPKLDFVIILHEFFLSDIQHDVHERALVAEEAIIERNVHVGAHTCIGPEVTIGKNTVIKNNVVISGTVRIGSDCVIKDNTIIGSEGYGFVYNDQNEPIHIPQLGAITIGDKVWIGSNTTIERAELKGTVIESDIKIDDLVHIGGGSHISSKCMITAGSILGRNVTLGKECWLAPNVSVREDITIEENVLVGQGSVVLKNLARGGVYVGIPARFLKYRDDK